MDNIKELNKLKLEMSSLYRHNFDGAIAVAYLVYCLKQAKTTDFKLDIEDMCKFIDDEAVRNFVYRTMQGMDKSIIENLSCYAAETLKTFILNSEDDESDIITPQSICKLVVRLLDIKENESIVDSCMGIGKFLETASDYQPHANYHGIEYDSDTACIAKIRRSLLNKKFNIELGNVLNIDPNKMTFHKGFSNHPIGISVKKTIDGTSLYGRVMRKFSELTKGTSADWLFAYRLSEMISEKSIAIMSLGCLWNTIDRPIREAYAFSGMVQAVIKLPPKLYYGMSVPLALIVFEKSDGFIRFIDASNEFVSGRRQNALSDENIDKILEAREKDSSISRRVNINEIEENQFSFNPSQYLEATEEVLNGVSFENVINNITRGAQCAPSELDNMTSSVVTDYQYLTSSNIRNGVIDASLPYLKEIPPRYEKYCAKKGNLLISKNGYPFKIAVVEKQDKKLLVNGNLYIIQLDETRVNPYYLKAYLESEQGTSQLKRIIVGATVPNIGVAQLNTIKIPLIDLEKQNLIGARYKAVLDETELLKRKIDEAENSVKGIFLPRFIQKRESKFKINRRGNVMDNQSTYPTLSNYNQSEFQINDTTLVRFFEGRKVQIPYGIKYIGANAFEDGDKITEIIIPNSVEGMDISAFSGCINLKKITLPIKALKNLSDISLYFGHCGDDLEFDLIFSDEENQTNFSSGLPRVKNFIPKQLEESKELNKDRERLIFEVGKDKDGNVVTCNLEKTPNLLIVGAVNDRSKLLNSIICSYISKSSPDDLRLVLVDSQNANFTQYEDMPHLLIKANSLDYSHAINVLKWAKREIQRRYDLFEKQYASSIDEFNYSEAVQNSLEKKLARVVVIVDELAELIVGEDTKEVQNDIMFIAEEAEASGIHLILATQQPTLNVITGAIKANMSARIAFEVKTKRESRIIFDEDGVENLSIDGMMIYASYDSNGVKCVRADFTAHK